MAPSSYCWAFSQATPRSWRARLQCRLSEPEDGLRSVLFLWEHLSKPSQVQYNLVRAPSSGYGSVYPVWAYRVGTRVRLSFFKTSIQCILSSPRSYLLFQTRFTTSAACRKFRNPLRRPDLSNQPII